MGGAYLSIYLSISACAFPRLLVFVSGQVG